MQCQLFKIYSTFLYILPYLHGDSDYLFFVHFFSVLCLGPNL